MGNRANNTAKRFCAVVLMLAIAVLTVLTSIVTSFFLIPETSYGLTKARTIDIRVFGQTRYDTAFKVADTLLKSYGSFDSIIVTSGEAYPDALSGSYLAYEEDAPLLLIKPGMEGEVYNYIQAHLRSRGTVYILGGRYAVSEAFEERLESAGIDVERLAGQNRYETNLAILEENMPRGDEILICSGKGFADSLSVSATGMPIMLVDTYLTMDQIDFLKEIKPKKIYIVGGISAVSTAVAIRTELIADTERIGGETRFDTSVLIAEEFFDSDQETVVLTNGMNYPDGLSGAPLAMYLESPIILTNDDADLSIANDYVNEVGASISYTLGGTAALSQVTVDAIMTRYIEEDPDKPRQDIGTAEDVLDVMRSWLGYDEVNGKYKEIIDIYNDYKPLPVGYKVKYTDEWCDTCLTAAAIEAGCADIVGRECGVGRHLDIFRRKGIWIEDGTIVPEPGYVIIYNWSKSTQPNNWGASHIGYVESVILNYDDDGNLIYDDDGNPTGMVISIEGNYQERVARRTFPIGWGYIRGYAAPRYAE